MKLATINFGGSMYVVAIHWQTASLWGLVAYKRPMRVSSQNDKNPSLLPLAMRLPLLIALFFSDI